MADPIELRKVTEFKNPAVDEVQRACEEFAKIAKENGMTAILLLAISPTQRFATRVIASPADQLKLIGLLELMKTELVLDLAEESFSE